MTATQPGTLVSYREREWVVLPSEDEDLVLLRPVGGSSREICGVVKSVADLMAYSLPHERIKPAQFPLPEADQVQDHTAVQLLQAAARLLLREGAAPFRSLGHLSVRPRPYQYVPLLMALRLETVRLLIADDVGVGKTIEASLIARELLDRGAIRRVAVLCPSYLCDQWRKELAEKFHIDAVVIRSGTIARLERQTPPDRSIFQHYQHFVASIDTVKSERYRAAFLQHCPPFVIVDEVHGAAAPRANRRSRSQQQRHELLLDLAEDSERHLLLLSATPHSGVEDSFLSVLGLLQPAFRHLDLTGMSSEERGELARHFVQRRRVDVKDWMGSVTPFPERDTEGAERPYLFSRAYRGFYDEVYDFARQMVQTAETLTGWGKRMRFWSALALMRCVTSSPAAAEVALQKRIAKVKEELEDLLEETTADELDATFEPMVYDPDEVETAVDAPPGSVFDMQEQAPDWHERDRRRLRSFARMAHQLRGDDDNKLQKLIEVLTELLDEGYQPIVWCRYIATADYLAEELQKKRAGPLADAKVTAVTGAISEDERRLKVEALAKAPMRILVATDCLSEGINLQDHFTAVVHYDLPWNPNRLEQREGRVDRFGQTAPIVKAVMIFGEDNPVDGAVLEVLLRKARDIYRQLGVRVPVPMESESVMEAVLNSLFKRPAGERAYQLSLFDQPDESGELVWRVHREWTRAAEEERENRTRFAQRAIKPEEVAQELEQTDTILGSPDDVRRFLLEASQRLTFGFRPEKNGNYLLNVDTLPPTVALRLGNVPDPWSITFDSPTPAGMTFVGRNNPLVEGLSEYLLDLAFHPDGRTPPAARCGVISTDAVGQRTTLLLLRLRYLQREWGAEQETLAEETLTWGFTGWPPEIQRITPRVAQGLLDGAQPVGNLSLAQKQEVLEETLDWWETLQPELEALLEARAQKLEASHYRVRQVIEERKILVRPQMPPDLLGVVVFLPVPKGVSG